MVSQNLNPQFEMYDLEMNLAHTVLKEITNSVDEMLAMTAGHQIVSASEIADKLLDLRILVSQLNLHQGEPHGDDQ